MARGSEKAIEGEKTERLTVREKGGDGMRERGRKGKKLGQKKVFRVTRYKRERLWR